MNRGTISQGGLRRTFPTTCAERLTGSRFRCAFPTKAAKRADPRLVLEQLPSAAPYLIAAPLAAICGQWLTPVHPRLRDRPGHVAKADSPAPAIRSGRAP